VIFIFPKLGIKRGGYNLLSKMSKYRREETSSEDTDSEEERRKKDIKERDSFANRLRAKDESKRRNVAMLPGSGAGRWPREYL